MPSGFFSATPITPASSRASMVAALRPLLPFIGQPFGTMKRWVVLEVMSKTSMRPSASRRTGMAATWRIALPFFALRMIGFSLGIRFGILTG